MLKKYLMFNKIVLEPSDKGICNGLAVVFCKYAVENREQEFLQMLHDIHKKGQEIEATQINRDLVNQVEQIDTSELNKFIAEVVFGLKSVNLKENYQ